MLIHKRVGKLKILKITSLSLLSLTKIRQLLVVSQKYRNFVT